MLRRYGLALGLGLIAGSAATLAMRRAGKEHFDLHIYWDVGRTFLTAPETVYEYTNHAGYGMTYPPFAAVTFAVLALLPLGVVYALYPIGLSVALAAAVARCLEEIGWSRHWTGLIIGLAFLTEPLWKNLLFGQLNIFVVCLVLFDLLRPRDARARGVLLGLAIGIKVTPGLFLPFLLVTGQYRSARNALLTVAATVALAAVFAPRASWEYWTQLLYQPQRVGDDAYSYNQAVSGVLARVHGGEGSGTLWLVICLALIATGLYAARLAWQRRAHLLAISLVAVTSLLCSPISWSHHWIWFVPAGVATVGFCADQYRTLVPAAAALAAWWSAFVFAPHIHGADPPSTDMWMTIVWVGVHSPYPLWGLLWLGLILVQLRWPRSRSRSVRANDEQRASAVEEPVG